jgi:hypothetical protein
LLELLLHDEQDDATLGPLSEPHVSEGVEEVQPLPPPPPPPSSSLFGPTIAPHASSAGTHTLCCAPSTVLTGMHAEPAPHSFPFGQVAAQ